MPTIQEILATCEARTPKTNAVLLSEVIDSAPESLNTLNEIAAAINDNATFYNTVVIKNNDITAGTGTKITYDKKGLVTSSASVTISDLPTNSTATTAANGFMSKDDKKKLDTTLVVNQYFTTEIINENSFKLYDIKTLLNNTNDPLKSLVQVMVLDDDPTSDTYNTYINSELVATIQKTANGVKIYNNHNTSLTFSINILSI